MTRPARPVPAAMSPQQYPPRVQMEWKVNSGVVEDVAVSTRKKQRNLSCGFKWLMQCVVSLCLLETDKTTHLRVWRLCEVSKSVCSILVLRIANVPTIRCTWACYKCSSQFVIFRSVERHFLWLPCWSISYATWRGHVGYLIWGSTPPLGYLKSYTVKFPCGPYRGFAWK